MTGLSLVHAMHRSPIYLDRTTVTQLYQLYHRLFRR